MKKTLLILMVISALASCNQNHDYSYKSAPNNTTSELDSTLLKKVTFLRSVQSPNKYNKHGRRHGLWTIYFDDNFYKINDLENVAYYRIIKYKNGKHIGDIVDYYSTGTKQWIGNLTSDTINDVIIGKASWFNYQGKLTQTNYYKNGIKDGEEIDYDINGKVIARRSYPIKTIEEPTYYYNNRTHESNECEYCGEADECSEDCDCEGGCEMADCQCEDNQRRRQQQEDEDEKENEDESEE